MFFKRTIKKRFFVSNTFVYSLLPEGNDELQKNCWQEGHNACCILHKLLANDWIPGIYRGFKAPEEYSFVNKTTKMETDNEVEVWHAMRATYRRELDAVHLLEKENLGCYKVSIRKGKKVRTLVPVIRNLVFVHARPSDVQRVKSQITYLQYITDTRSGQKIIIPDHEMQRFIAVAGTYNDHLLYFQPEELNLSKGTRVRITGGDFAGQEGIFLKVKGARDRRVVIEIQGVIAVAMATIHPDLIEVIK